jgi:uncharacterized protein
MSVTTDAPVQLSATAFHTLRSAVLQAPEGETRLRDAGWTAGSTLYETLDARVRAETGRGAAEMPLDTFVQRASTFLTDAGWGAIALGSGEEDGVVVIEAADWTEADGASRAGAPACHFGTGLLAGFFGRLAGAPLAVLETECRSAGGTRCRFLVGSPAVLQARWEESRRA